MLQPSKETGGSEEDTSSTTTEFSNNEDNEKENLTTVIKSEKNRITKKLKMKNEFKDNYEGDDEDNEKKVVSHTHHHQWKLRSDLKLPKTNGELIPNDNKTDHLNPKRNNRSINRDKKDKQSNKRADKPNGKQPDPKFPTNSSSTRTTPTIPPPNCWGENRAKFSEVVAGSDTSTTTPKDKKLANSVNSLFNFDLKMPESDNTQLGPIGSKKPTVNIWETLPNVCGTGNLIGIGGEVQNCQEPSSSFFMNNFMDSGVQQNLQVENTMDHSIMQEQVNPINYGGDIWETQNSAAVLNMLHNSARSMLGDYTQTNNYYPSKCLIFLLFANLICHKI